MDGMATGEVASEGGPRHIRRQVPMGETRQAGGSVGGFGVGKTPSEEPEKQFPALVPTVRGCREAVTSPVCVSDATALDYTPTLADYTAERVFVNISGDYEVRNGVAGSSLEL